MTNESTQSPTINPDKLSGQYLLVGLWLGLSRMLWHIAETSGLLGTPPSGWVGTVSDLLTFLTYLLAVVGLATFWEIYRRRQSQQNEPIRPLILNYVGYIMLLIFVERVDFVTATDPTSFAVWAQLAIAGIILGGVYALIALGYTLVYGILFMINFAHGEVMMLGAYCGYFAMLYLTQSDTQSFEDGAAGLSMVIVPLVVGAVFLAQYRSDDSKDDEDHEVELTNRVTRTLLLPLRFGFGLLVGYGILAALGSGAPHIFALVITAVGVMFVMVIGMAASTIVAIALERVAYRPLRNAPRLVPLISAIGASLFLQQVAQRIFGPGRRGYPAPELLSNPPNFVIDLGTLGVLNINKVGVFVVIMSILLMVALYIIVQRTKIGKAMRAVAEDKETAALMGIDVDRVIAFTFMLGAALAGAAGVMLGLRGDDLNPRFGFTPGLKAFTAAVLGGIGNIPGAMLGGFFLGFVESVGPLMLGIGFQWKNLIAFGLLVIVLIFRPTGILGEIVSGKKV